MLVLDRDEPHAGSLHRFADRLGIGGIVFVGLDVGLHVLRRDQSNLMPEPVQLACPKMGTTAGLEPNKAGREVGEEDQDLGSGQLSLENRTALPVGAVDLKRALGDVETDRGNMHADVSRCRGRSSLPRWHIDAVGGRRPSHYVWFDPAPSWCGSGLVGSATSWR